MKKLPSRLKITNNRGFVLVTILVTTLLIALTGIATTQLVLSNLQLANAESYRVNTQLAADAGLDDAIQNLNQDQTYIGSGGEVVLFEDDKKIVKYQTTITPDADPLKKYLEVTARTFAPKTSPTPRNTRKYHVELRGVSGGNFSVVTGVGGLIMTNSAKIVGGAVYVNGEITMSNYAQIGLTTNPVTVRAAHQNCPSPPDATYPRTCNSGENGEPITFNNSAKIYGEVKGTNQTNGANMYNPGLVPGSVPPTALPTHDRNAQIAAVTSTQTGASAGCNNGTKVWPANLKITGDVTISNTCKVTVEGDVWITGKFTMTQSAELIVQNGLTIPPNVMIDGINGLDAGNSSIFKSNTSPTPVGFRILTYYSRAACSPDCANVTGTDLFNSRNDVTIKLNNNASGPQTEFYARWTRVTISNSGNIGALVGQTVELANSGTITFGTSVAGVSGGISAWVVKSYRRVF